LPLNFFTRLETDHVVPHQGLYLYQCADESVEKHHDSQPFLQNVYRSGEQVFDLGEG